MAVGTGAGPLNVTKPIGVNDMMEAIQLPGLKPKNGVLLDAGAGTDFSRVTGQICTLGAAGYTEVVDDIIIEVVEVIDTSGGTEKWVDIDIGYTNDLGDITTKDAHFLAKGASALRLTDAHAKGTLVSVLRGNLPNSATWAATASHVNERTFGPGALDEPIGDAAGVANTERQQPLRLCVVTTNGTNVDQGMFRIYVRTHYTDVNFGAGL